jgi:O-antigen/teichoic acid export membrane protein
LNIGHELVKGTVWTAIGRYIHFFFQIGITAVLARLLEPADFGVVGMVVVYTGFVDLLAEFGLSATIVQKRYLDREGLSTVFWLSTLIGLILMGVTLLLSPLIEAFFDFEGLRIVIQVMSITLLLSAMSVVLHGKLQQRLAFKELAITEIFTSALAGCVGIVLAFQGWGYWALVLQGISFKLFRLVWLYFYERWLPLFTIKPSVMRDVFSFSGNVLGFRSINYWARNADNLLVGRFLGAAQLGFYNQAYKLMMYPIQLITNIITPSLQPVFATVQDEPRKMTPAYLKILELVALITFPTGLFLSLFAGPIIRLLWGDQWIESIPVFEVLAILTMFQPVVSTSGSVFLARNRANLLFKLGIVNSLIMIAGISIGLAFGIVGVAYGYAIAYLSLVFPITIYFLARTLDEKPYKLFFVFLKPLFITLLLAPVLFFVRSIQFPWGDIGMLGSAAMGTLIFGLAGSLLFYRDYLWLATNKLRLIYSK